MKTATKTVKVTPARGDSNKAGDGWFVGIARSGTEWWCYSPKTTDFVAMCKNFDSQNTK